MALKRTQTASMFDNLKNTIVKEQKTDKKEETIAEPIKPKSPEKQDKTESKKNTELPKKAQPDELETVETQENAANHPIIDQEAAINPPADEPTVEKNKEAAKPEPQNTESNIFDFGNLKERELKSVRKQFVFTPTYAKWIKDTAKFNNISENMVIENLITMAMNKKNF